MARREGFTVERAACADADGFTTWRNRRIRIRPDATPGEAVTALAHQFGHVLLHSHSAQAEPSGTVPCTGIRKVEADSVAYLTAAQLGLDTTQLSFSHVSAWAGTDPRARPATTIRTVTGHVLAATGTITTRLAAAGITGPHPAGLPDTARPTVADQHTAPPVPPGEIARAHDTAAKFFYAQMPGTWVPDYLASRGLAPAIQDQWLAGYAPAAWDALTSHMRSTGYPDTVIEASGLARRTRRGTLIDTFRDRAMLPIRSHHGTVIAFIGRATEHADPATTPKYLNSPATALYEKSAVLFGLWEARDALAHGARPVLVEGPLDAIAVTTAGQGQYAGVAPCGTAFTDHQATILSQAADLMTAGVLTAFDPDQAGRRAAVRAYHLLAPHTEKMTAVTLPPGQDPAHVLARSGAAALKQLLDASIRPLPDLVTNAEVLRWGRRLQYPEGRLSALRAAAPLVAAMPPAHVARQVAHLAAMLRLDYTTVTTAVTDALDDLTAPTPSTRHDRPKSRADPQGSRLPLGAARDATPRLRQPIERPAAAAPAPARSRRGRPRTPGSASGRIPG